MILEGEVGLVTGAATGITTSTQKPLAASVIEADGASG